MRRLALRQIALNTECPLLIRALKTADDAWTQSTLVQTRPQSRPSEAVSAITAQPAMVKLFLFISLLLLSGHVDARAPSDDSVVKLTLLGYSRPGDIDTNTEQVAFDDAHKVAYLIGENKLFVLDLSSTILPIDTSRVPLGADNAGQQLPVLASRELPATITDVQQCGGYLAISAESVLGKTFPGQVLIYNTYRRDNTAASLALLANFTVGALPDQIEVSRDCRTILVSNEGEPSGYGPGDVDPEGSVSVINLRFCTRPRGKGRGRGCQGPPVQGIVRTATFTAWNSRKDQLLAEGIKINGPGATVAQDLEPEYATFSEDEQTAFVALQENNAIAVLDVKSATITGIFPLGLKDHSKLQNALDASDRDGAINIAAWPVFGMHQPDEMKSFRAYGADFVVMANEGDAREYEDSFVEDGRVEDIIADLDPRVFPNAAARFGDEAELGRLTVLVDKNKLNDINGDGKYDRILSFGSRGFSIYRADYGRSPRSSGRGKPRISGLTPVYDSGAQLEEISAREVPDLFNSEGTADTKDERSDNKGPEPEGLAVGYAIPKGHLSLQTDSATEGADSAEVQHSGGNKYGKRCLFLGTERLSSVFVYDITDPYRPVYQSMALPPQADPADDSTRLLAPEGVTYARYSLMGRSVPIVLVAYEGEDQGGMAVYRVDTV